MTGRGLGRCNPSDAGRAGGRQGGRFGGGRAGFGAGFGGRRSRGSGPRRVCGSAGPYGAGVSDWNDVDEWNQLNTVNADLHQKLKNVQTRLAELEKQVVSGSGQIKETE